MEVADWGCRHGDRLRLPAALSAKVYGYGMAQGPDFRQILPILVVLLVVIRAGMVEELFYRAYPTDRQSGSSFGRSASIGDPLVIFGVSPLAGGAVNITWPGTWSGDDCLYQWRIDRKMFATLLVGLVNECVAYEVRRFLVVAKRRISPLRLLSALL